MFTSWFRLLLILGYTNPGCGPTTSTYAPQWELQRTFTLRYRDQLINLGGKVKFLCPVCSCVDDPTTSLTPRCYCQMSISAGIRGNRSAVLPTILLYHRTSCGYCCMQTILVLTHLDVPNSVEVLIQTNNSSITTCTNGDMRPTSCSIWRGKGTATWFFFSTFIFRILPGAKDAQRCIHNVLFMFMMTII